MCTCVVMQWKLEGWGGGKWESEGILCVVQWMCICIYPEPVTLGSYIYSVMSFTSQLTTKLGKAFANSSVPPALNHCLSHM